MVLHAETEKWKKPELVKFSWLGSKRVAENMRRRAGTGGPSNASLRSYTHVIFKSNSTYGNVARLFEENLS